ncbi:MAG: DNA-3-methyladenine glycosylase I [Mycobacteriaceae bacterium]|nr:DNA-3-methyladenine glycosylase I [Mycobacteriaceae bacterium]
MFDDGLVRCSWAEVKRGTDRQLYQDYHDQEWGRPVHDGIALFERLSLEAFQSGLSWLIILRKRENFRRAFSGFDIETVAGYTDADVHRLMSEVGIVRNRAKIEATIANARAAVDLGSAQDLAQLLWSFAPPRRARPVAESQIASASVESRAMARELKRRQFRFVGPTTAYALMQATGMVDDHVSTCWVPPAME